MTLSLPLYTQDQSYAPWLLRRYMKAMRTPGVNQGTGFIVTVASGLQVSVSAGDAFVAQTVEAIEPSPSDVGIYYVYNDGAVNPTNTISAPLTNPRVDQVILRVYDAPEQGLGIASKAQVEWVTGAETAGATLSNLSGVAALPSNSLRLAYVLQTVGELSVSSGNIQNVAPLSIVAPANGAVMLRGTFQTGSTYTAKDGDLVEAGAAGAATYTLPDAAAAHSVGFTNFSGHGVVVQRAGGATIIGPGLAGVTQFALSQPGAFVVLVSDFANWFVVAGGQDTGWVPLTLPGGVTAATGTATPSARLQGDTVRLKGSVTNSSGGVLGALTIVGTIASGLRHSFATAPSFPVVNPGGGLTVINVYIDSAGAVRIGPPFDTGSSLVLDNLSYSLS